MTSYSVIVFLLAWSVVSTLATFYFWKKADQISDEYDRHLAATEDRFYAIAQMETPNAAPTVKKMAAVAEAALEAKD